MHTHKQRYDNTPHHKRARAKHGKIIVKAVLFRIDHFIKPKRNGVFVSIADNRIDEDKIAPRRNKRRQHRINDNGLGERQNNLGKDHRLTRSVQNRRLLHRPRNGIEKSLADIIRERRAPRINQDERQKRVREPHRFEYEIHGDHTHKTGEHTQN